jgi:hypothetical protein
MLPLPTDGNFGNFLTGETDALEGEGSCDGHHASVLPPAGRRDCSPCPLVFVTKGQS